MHQLPEIFDSAALGIKVNGSRIGNSVTLHPQFSKVNGLLTINFSGTGNSVYIDKDCSIMGTVGSPGDGGSVEIFGGQNVLNIDALIYANSSLSWRFGSNSFGVRIWVHGERHVKVGEHCLFSENIEIRTSDHHSIVDLKTRLQINHPADVVIGRHVWVSAGVTISKGVTIGTGSIIGARSHVISNVPAMQLWAGVPARLIRESVSWVGSHPAMKQHVDMLDEYLKPEISDPEVTFLYKKPRWYHKIWQKDR